MSTVDFFTNCWERDYQEVLSPNFMRDKVSKFSYPFRSVIVTINNVTDKATVMRLAQNAKARGDIDQFVFVEDALPMALKKCGLRKADLGRVAYFINFLLVTVTYTDADYVVHLSLDAEMDSDFDWITSGIAQLMTNEKYLVVNPVWDNDFAQVEKEAISRDADYYVCEGFSDQCFLIERQRFAQPIYRYRHPMGNRYPMSNVGNVFEQRIDAWMRRSNLLRLVDTRTNYTHTGDNSSHLTPSVIRRIKNRLARIITKV